MKYTESKTIKKKTRKNSGTSQNIKVIQVFYRYFLSYVLDWWFNWLAMDAQAKRVLKEVNANPGEQGYTHMVKKPGQLSDDVTQLPTELPGFSKERYYQLLYWRLLFSFWGFPKSVECWMSSVSGYILEQVKFTNCTGCWGKKWRWD